MKIKGILSERNRFRYRSYQIVYEWEDTFSKSTGIPVVPINGVPSWIVNKFKRIRADKLPIYLERLCIVRNYYLYMQMTADIRLQFSNSKRIIPYIIDFWLRDNELEAFLSLYQNSKAMLVSSLEAYETLKSKNPKQPLYHLPLSIPDQYIKSERINKPRKFDFLLAGRVNPLFMNYVKQYATENPDVEYVYQEMKNHQPLYFSNKRGELTEDYLDREKYAELLSDAKFSFYSTPGKDPSKEGANGYNQITPRFLELISSGCIVFGQYADNEEAEFYEMNKFCCQINNYEEFKSLVNYYSIETHINEQKSNYIHYLNRHCTSQSALLLEKIIHQIESEK
jgi:hypothetical protein